MSDWRSRAVPAETAAGWRSRAEPVGQAGPGFLTRAKDAAVQGLITAGQTIDKYTGAPTRAAIGSLQDDMNLGKAATAFTTQFGEDPTKAPTGRDIARKAGVPDTPLSQVVPSLYSETGEGLPLEKGGILDPTASGAAGFAVDVAADPSLLVPLGKIGAIGSGGLKKVTDTGAKVARGVGGAASSGGLYVSKKLGSLISGVPEKEIETYIRSYPEVQKMIRAYGDNVPEAADTIRQGFQTSIRAKRAELGKQIEKTLESLPDEKVIDATPIIGELQKVQGRLNETLRLEEVKQIDELVGRIQAVAGEEMRFTPRELNEVKRFLQDRGAAAFLKDGQIFVPGKEAQIAAKNASRVARQTLNTISPTIAQTNNDLQKLHLIEEKINKNLIAPGKSEAGLLSAGSGVNPRNVKNLERLEEATGAPIMHQAEVLSATKRFADPGLSAMDTTGKAVERMAKASIIGLGAGGVTGAAVAAALTSPMALKLAIQSGRIPIEGFKALTGGLGAVTEATVDIAYRSLHTPAGQAGFDAAIRGMRAGVAETGKPKDNTIPVPGGNERSMHGR